MDKNFKGTPEEYIEFRKRRNEANKKYYSRPEVKEKKRNYKQEYDIKNKDKISKYGYEKRARPENKERIAKWKKENKEHLKEYYRQPIIKAKKKIADKIYNQKNRHKINKVHIAWKERHPGITKKYNQKYYTSPKGKISYTHHNHRRLALIKERPTDLTNDKIMEIVNRDKVCVYCNSNQALELDHIIPLAKGGSCMFNNFVIACKKCNCSKSDRDVFVWCSNQGIQVPIIVLQLLSNQEFNKDREHKIDN
jgi:5-methylcytosine-specific restriction endonuclease McrA